MVKKTNYKCDKQNKIGLFLFDYAKIQVLISEVRVFLKLEIKYIL
jgi:hypothetical protein